MHRSSKQYSFYMTRKKRLLLYVHRLRLDASKE